MNKLELSLQKIKEQEFSNDEEEMNNFGKNMLKLVNTIFPGEKYKQEWESFDYMKKRFKENINNYSGIHYTHFKKMLESIEEQERQALGYHIHSD
jgi:hypothetical protein